jgi:hypothetical protein
VVEKILWLRQQYHFGPQKIAMYLKRYHDITISSSGVWRILHKVGLGRLPASQRYKRKDTKWKRYEKQRPGHALQVDVMFDSQLKNPTETPQVSEIGQCPLVPTSALIPPKHWILSPRPLDPLGRIRLQVPGGVPNFRNKRTQSELCASQDEGKPGFIRGVS